MLCEARHRPGPPPGWSCIREMLHPEGPDPKKYDAPWPRTADGRNRGRCPPRASLTRINAPTGSHP
ncbi:hypothetical protein GCM10019016_103520 [Streptomyces prasinosporus]|uniref:Uncharacterized protein n=1 Tax=Streptomyces prasinosporus TaxID=68256 RepID=A0ABP6U6B4_9ACTN